MRSIIRGLPTTALDYKVAVAKKKALANIIKLRKEKLTQEARNDLEDSIETLRGDIRYIVETYKEVGY